MSERWKPSVTVAAIIQRQTDGITRYLLVEEHTPEGLKLNNPAGHLDPGESPQQGAVREALEETACVFTPDRLLGVYLARMQRQPDEDVTYVRFAFGGTAGEERLLQGLALGGVRRQSFDGDDAGACRLRHGHQTGAGRFTVDQHRAGAAIAGITARLGSHQAKLAAQHVAQSRHRR